jgi:hypothetical protein
MRDYVFGTCRVVKPFKQLHPLTLPDGAQIFSEFKSVELYMEDLRLNASIRRDARKSRINNNFSMNVQSELDKLNVRKQPIFRR